MAKYGSFKYGTAKYGTATAGPQPTYTGEYLYTLNIKWGSSFVNEAERLVDAYGDRGRQFYVGQSGESFENIQPGEFTFVLDNFDLRYDPYNASGALYNLIEPGKAVEFSVKYLATGVRYPIFAGRIKDIRPTSGRNQVQVVVYDALQWLADQAITIPTGFNLKVHEAIDAVLNAASYPGNKSIASSNCPITFFDPQEDVALDVIRELADAGLGTVFVDHSGTLKYYDLTTTGQSTTILDQAVLHKEITVTQPWDTVRNKITCVANRFGYGPTEEIWRMDEPLGVPAGTVSTFRIEFEQAKVQQPVRGVDYTDFFTWENFVVGVGFLTTHYYFTVSLTDITTTGATVNVSNNETDYLYLQFLTIRGQKLVNKKISFDSIDATSAAKGPRRLRIDSPWLQDRGFAAAYAPLLLGHLKDPSKDPVITIETRPDGLGIDLLDRINLTSAKLGIDVTYDVGYISYKWTKETGQGFQQTFHLQNILYSTATITPQPFYPALPPVPPVTPPPGTEAPPGTGTTGRAIDCTQDYPVLVNATGPFAAGSGMIDNSHPSMAFTVGKWFRSIYHTSRTYIDIDALWETQAGGVWTPDATFDFSTVAAMSSLGVQVATGSINGSLVSDGVRRYIFNNTSPKFVQQVQLSLPAVASTTYIPGDVIYNEALPATTNSYATVPVTNGLFYALESLGGPYQVDGDGEGTLRYSLFISYDPNANEGSDPFATAGLPTDNLNIANMGLYLENYDGTHGRIYFQAKAGSVIARINSWTAGEGWNKVISSGGLNYVLRTAIVSGGDKRVTIRSINIYNVCDPDSTMIP